MSIRRGIILVGGKGTRLYPTTRFLNKHLLLIYSKPMVYYALSTLMLAGIRKILLISNPEDNNIFVRVLEDGSKWGIELTYAIQHESNGIAEALVIAESFLSGKPTVLVLGDNMFHGTELQRRLRKSSAETDVATIFAYPVGDPSRYAVVEVDAAWRPLSIKEKPQRPLSCYAVPGIYFLDKRAPQIARNVKPSLRGELEITTVLEYYLKEGTLTVESLGRGTMWLDVGTVESLQQASRFVETIETRQRLMIGCPEEIAWRLGWLSDENLEQLGQMISNSPYGRYLLELLDEPGPSYRSQVNL